MGTRNSNKKLGPTIGEIIDRRWGVVVETIGAHTTLSQKIRDLSGGVCDWSSSSGPNGYYAHEFKYSTKELAMIKVRSFSRHERVKKVILRDWSVMPPLETVIFERKIVS